MTVLDVKHLSVSAWGAALLNDVSLCLEAGELMAIIGPNGAGKTTLINTLVGVEHSTQIMSGEITLCGAEHDHWLPEDRARHVALLPQLSLLNFPYTVEEVVQLSRIPHSTGKVIDASIVEQALVALDIRYLKDRLYTQLSGGEKQRVQLARVMAQIWREDDASQRLLLLDEPTSSLDLGHQQQLMDIIRTFADQQVAIIMVAHDINLVAHHADKLLALRCGEVVAQGTPEETVSPELMKALYNVEVDVIPHPETTKPVVILKNQ